MAEYFITQTDIDLLQKPKKLHLRAYLLNQKNQIIDNLDGLITSGSGSDDSASDIRKSCNFTIHSLDDSYNIGEYNRIWLKNRVRIDIGFEDFERIYWYTKGIYLFDSCNYAFSGSSRDITFTCSDLVKSIDGTHGGLIDSKSILIKGHSYDEKTGLWNGNDVKGIVEDLLLQNNITDFRVDTIGQISCLQGYAANWKQNRIDTGTSLESVTTDEANGYDNLENDHGTWHMVPYDLEFSANTTLWDILVKLRDLYPGYEMFFDKDGMFVFQPIPICNHDIDVLEHTQFEGLVISENAANDLTAVKNATRVYGENIDPDRYSNTSSLITATLDENPVLSTQLELENFSITTNTIVGVTFPEFSETYLTEAAHLTINGETFPITLRKAAIDEDAENGSSKNTIVYEPMTYASFNTRNAYCFKFLSYQKMWVYTGMYQIEGYAENNDENSPFAIGKIGYRLQIKSGGIYDNITSSIQAQEQAEYENWLASRLTDTLTLETVFIPFLEVNQKIQYRKLSDGSIDSYIIKSLSYSLTEGTMTITMIKFYELDPFIVCS